MTIKFSTYSNFLRPTAFRKIWSVANILIRSIITYVVLRIGCIYYFAFAGPLTMICGADNETRLKVRRASASFVMLVTRVLCNVKYEVIGEIPDMPCIFMATHQSTADIAIATNNTKYLGNPVIIAKKELKPVLFSMPNLYFINRESSSSLIKMLRVTKEHISQGRNVLLFAEGTRKKHGGPISIMPSVAAFYSAGIAKTIVPLYIRTGNISPGKADFWIKPGKALMVVLPAIEINREKMSAKEFARHLEEVFNEARINYGNNV